MNLLDFHPDTFFCIYFLLAELLQKFDDPVVPVSSLLTSPDFIHVHLICFVCMLKDFCQVSPMFSLYIVHHVPVYPLIDEYLFRICLFL